jgi:hypothetical protein
VFPEILAVASVLIAVVALARAWSVSRKFKTISQSYWQLRYDFARLRARVAKLDGGAAGETDEPAGTSDATAP